MTSNTVVCNKCLVAIEFDDDGTADCMPDGAIEGGKWYCDDCCYETGIFHPGVDLTCPVGENCQPPDTSEGRTICAYCAEHGKPIS